MKQTVVNLLDHCLMPDETTVLANGGKFTVTQRSVLVEDIITSIEASIQSLPHEVAEDIRSDAARILQ